MKSPLLEKIRDFTHLPKHRQTSAHKNIKLLIEKLERKTSDLNNKLHKETDSRKRRRLEIELMVLSAQRNKGINILKHS